MTDEDSSSSGIGFFGILSILLVVFLMSAWVGSIYYDSQSHRIHSDSYVSAERVPSELEAETTLTISEVDEDIRPLVEEAIQHYGYRKEVSDSGVIEDIESIDAVILYEDSKYFVGITETEREGSSRVLFESVIVWYGLTIIIVLFLRFIFERKDG